MNRSASGTLSIPALLMTLVATFLAAWLTLGVFGRSDQLIYLWPLTGLQLGLLLPLWRRDWAAVLARQTAGAVGLILGAAVAGLPPGIALMIGLINACEVFLCGWIVSPAVANFDDLKERAHVLRFGIAAIVAPAVMGSIAAIPVAPVTHQSFLHVATTSVLSDALGIAIVMPVVLFLTSGEYRSFKKLRPHLLRTTLTGSAFVATAVYTFWQNQNPLLYIVFPLMVIMVLAMGLEGATLSGVVLTIVATTATNLHHGPFWLAVNASAEHRMVLLQLFLIVSAATALPIGALLDERRREGRAAEEARSIYQTLLQNAEDTIILSSFDGTRRYISPAIKTLTGWTPAEFLAMDRMQTFHPDDRDMARLVMESMAGGKRQHVIRYRIAQKEGGYRWVEAVARAYFDETSDTVLGYVGTIRDISSLKQTEEIWQMERETLTREKLAMARLANTDALTVLPNRRAFDDALLRQLSRAAAVSVMMIDVDFFKAYNDLYGHQAGDDCLRQIAQALQSKVGRGGDVVARLGGEEFGVLLPGADAGGARRVAESMLNAIWELDIPHQSSPIGRITISIGIANWADIREHDTALLIQQADRALYVSKRAGKNQVTIAGTMPVAV